VIYADTSFFVSLRIDDENSAAAEAFMDAHADAEFIWSPINRIELFNTIRQAAFRGQMSEADARHAIHLLERDVSAGYFLHQEADWRDVMKSANNISDKFAFATPCRAADLLHIAYAVQLSADRFISFDRDQVVLAKKAGLKANCLC
jgi:predicted nucleic acid-binding protein